jgi:hypothetical protein
VVGIPYLVKVAEEVMWEISLIGGAYNFKFFSYHPKIINILITHAD